MEAIISMKALISMEDMISMKAMINMEAMISIEALIIMEAMINMLINIADIRIKKNIRIMVFKKIKWINIKEISIMNTVNMIYKVFMISIK